MIQLAQQLASNLSLGDRVLLEGAMGAGKTTFARALLEALAIEQPPEGSPSFAIAHEYVSPQGPVVHMDLYRLRSADEIDEAGLPSYFWERKMIALTEWLSSWPEFQKQILESGPCWQVHISFEEEQSHLRRIRIQGP